MVRFSKVQQSSDFLETFPENFSTICPVSKFSEYLVEWKALGIARKADKRKELGFGQASIPVWVYFCLFVCLFTKLNAPLQYNIEKLMVTCRLRERMG